MTALPVTHPTTGDTLAGGTYRNFARTMSGTAIHGNTPFACPIVSNVGTNLWQGGVPYDGVPADFVAILDLYGWEPYSYSSPTERRVERLLDGDGVDRDQLIELATWVNEKRRIGPVLVHCQAGLNRSGLVAALALVLDGTAPDDAIAQVRARRSPAVLCNPHFEAALRSWNAA